MLHLIGLHFPLSKNFSFFIWYVIWISRKSEVWWCQLLPISFQINAEGFNVLVLEGNLICIRWVFLFILIFSFFQLLFFSGCWVSRLYIAMQPIYSVVRSQHENCSEGTCASWYFILNMLVFPTRRTRRTWRTWRSWRTWRTWRTRRFFTCKYD